MRQTPVFENVSSDLELKGRQLMLTIDRGTAARFGITTATVDNALYDAFGQRIASTYFTQTNQYRVIMNSDLSDISSVRQALDGIYLPSATATTGQTPLSAIVSISESDAPLKLEHLGQFPSASISFDLAAGASLDSAVGEIEKAEADIGLPESFTTAYQGALSAFQKSLSNEVYLILAAVAAVYIVLGVLYESFAHPITIISTLPSAGVGALLALNVMGAGLDVIGVIGIVLLIGIVKKNAIMMIDFALEAQRVEGKSPREAIHQACLLRFRPILMTTMSALFAALPLMFGAGHGLRIAPPARHLHRRRPPGQPAPDPVHHPRRLSCHRPGKRAHLRRSSAAGNPRRASASEALTAASAPGMNISAPFIARPVATTLVDDRDRACGRARITRRCRCRRCRRSIFPPSLSPPFCLEQVRTSSPPAWLSLWSGISDRSPT